MLSFEKKHLEETRRACARERSRGETIERRKKRNEKRERKKKPRGRSTRARETNVRGPDVLPRSRARQMEEAPDAMFAMF